MGCPELPVQTAAALYLASRLNREDFDVTAAGNRAAISLLLNSDPERHYIKKVMDIDRCIGELAQKRMDFDICFAFIHSDSGIAYLATVKALSTARTVAVIFGKEIEPLIEAGGDSIIIAAKAVHNPAPIRAKIDEVRSWAALMR
ncbi:hypothetical protein ANME2D_02681 [Candidatus Methanoperedens nitroreducens]|uniref:DUF1890 domain-containing protein n=1 Tax=Candidatus Methanoperedens nitratireducens TaxID=1392998 RepID=A0A062V4B2_9EURY|nr:DUF1890 domain-containing protein [Candidatus Methanoperedens nitroreducens]KCZ70659.1 hypothetical protein ANME2D_02681 [Candidatus Methanoperedens nitroreducens]MDJ1420512.1 DUF1890 domain-containing protein [Candidatus Methanoperedens sp.]